MHPSEEINDPFYIDFHDFSSTGVFEKNDLDLPQLGDFQDIGDLSEDFCNMLGGVFCPLEQFDRQPKQQAPKREYQEEKQFFAPKRRQVIELTKNVDMKLGEAEGLEGRTWQVSFSSQRFNKAFVEIKIKNRVERETAYIPEILYSSIKYQILVNVNIQDCEVSTNTLIARISIHDSETDEKIETDLKGKNPINGDVEIAVIEKVDKLTGKMTLRFGDLTYNKSKTDYYMVINFFEPSNLKDSVLTMTSPVFRNYARKPNKKRTRKVESTKTKKRKLDKVDIFQEKLNDMISLTKNMTGEAKERAFNMILERVYKEFK